MCLLMSRYGIDVKEDAIRTDVFMELAGNPDNVTTGVMDIRQLVAMLVIPHLAKMSHGVYVESATKEEQDPANLGEPLCPKGGEGAPMVINDRTIEILANEIVADTQENWLYGENHEPVITRDFLRRIFEAHDEVMVDDDVLDKMIEAVGGEGTPFNAKSFLEGLTKDLAAWNVEWETNLSTAYADVMGLDSLNRSIEQEKVKDSNKAKSKSSSKRQDNFKYSSSMHSSDAGAQMSKLFLEKARRVFTFSEIDNTADTYGTFERYFVRLCSIALDFCVSHCPIFDKS